VVSDRIARQFVRCVRGGQSMITPGILALTWVAFGIPFGFWAAWYFGKPIQ
jgi:hypothetical protein